MNRKIGFVKNRRKNKKGYIDHNNSPLEGFYDGKLKGFVSVEPELFGGAQEYNQKHVEAEPYDCQLECAL